MNKRFSGRRTEARLSVPGRVTGTAGSLLMGILAAAVILALDDEGDGLPGNGDPTREAFQPAIGPAESRAPIGVTDSPGDDALADPAPGTPAAQLLADSEAARRHLLGRAISDEGYPCAEILSAAALDGTGGSWRVNCGQSQLYWVGIDEFGRWSVEPGTYTEPFLWPTSEPAPVFESETIPLDE